MEINLSEGLRDLMRRYPQGVAVVTTEWKGKLVGMTVNTFNSLSLNPPLVLFIADRSRGNDLPFRDSPSFAVNLVDSREVLDTFATKPVETRFQEVKYQLSDEGVPILSDAYAYLIATRGQVVDIGDHAIIVGEAKEVNLSREPSPLVYYMRNYRKVCLP
ncbi:Ferric-chelate reductase (NAD(P)H) [Metallosphaera sp. J1]|uniref:flavin reductase family protein n=1 Tax=Metallosphaera javensis (ex Hofmann et al. 2022) TaxID=99938 RepID=UPI001EDEE45F|nr:flavin reductase family protein [Metallosphaera javensis (ex Hofmann et al. 2022)]MCG3109324.1 Ferric-chelate reductase (NAD(P)H) [Metallosphaera javensis (ex Hofmann et al. 2022)]